MRQAGCRERRFCDERSRDPRPLRRRTDLASRNQATRRSGGGGQVAGCGSLVALKARFDAGRWQDG